VTVLRLITLYAITVRIASSGNPSGYSGITAGTTVKLVVTTSPSENCTQYDPGDRVAVGMVIGFRFPLPSVVAVVEKSGEPTQFKYR
jgi:hypothetical protein